MFDRIADVIYAIKSVCFAQKKFFNRIEINGSKQFCERIFDALLLLKERDPQAYKIVDDSLSLLLESRETIFTPSLTGIGVGISRDCYETSLPWLASFIAYQGFKAKLLLEASKRSGVSVMRISKDTYSGKKVWDRQYECLKSLGADYDELKHLADFIEKNDC